ncbi:MAG: phosphoglycolate phosphatase [Gammaproteobacteria bacterium]
MSAAAAPRAIWFDLDGTLADTAPDLAYALNALRAEHGLAGLEFAAIRPLVSAGSYALIALGFGVQREDPRCEPLRDRLLAIYAAHLVCGTRLFPGMEAVLDALDRLGIAWGVVTNKPDRLAAPLLAGLGLSGRVRCLVGGDSTVRRKPHPDPLLRAAQLCGMAPGDCAYVGDAAGDIAAGRAAGMRTVAAAWGYIAPGDDPAGWRADAVADHPGQVLARLGLPA